MAKQKVDRKYIEWFHKIEPLPRGHYYQVSAKTYGRLLDELRGTAIIQLNLVPMKKVKKLYEEI